jgi:hypothetical protein
MAIRMEKERVERAAQLLKDAASGNKKINKKRKRNPDPLVGEQVRRFELVNAANVRRHAVSLCYSCSITRQSSKYYFISNWKGWTLDTANSTPLFSLVCRPSHPLPALPKAAPTSWTREAPKSKASKAARAILRAGGGIVPVLRVSRSRRVRIDVRKWGRIKTLFEENRKPHDGAMKAKGSWECVGDDAADDAKEEKKVDEVKWIFRAKDGSIKRTEMVQLTARSVPHTDSFAALLTAIDSAGFTSAATLSTALDHIATKHDGATTSTPTPTRARSLSPPRYKALRTRNLIYNEEDAFALLLSTQDAKEVVEARERERDSQLAILRSLIGGAPTARSQHKLTHVGSDDEDSSGEDGAQDEDDDMDEIFSTVLNKKPLVEGFNDEDDDADEVMRLRGGGSAEDTSDDDDNGEEGKVIEEKDKPKTSLKMGSLKDMFKPQESSGMYFPSASSRFPYRQLLDYSFILC